MTLKQVIEQMSMRPAMFLGDPTISRLEAFLLGWTHDPDNPAGEILSGFQKWIAERYKVRSSQSWATIIRFYASDDPSALKDAFALFKEYFELLEMEQRTE